MSKETTLWSYLLYLLPKLTFSLMATMLTEDQCNKIQSPTLMAALPKLRFNRHTERSIIHGPLLHGGLNLPHLYTIQGISQLKFLIGHLRAQDKTFKLIIIRHGYLQLLVSTQSNFLSSPYQIYSRWACHSWFVFLWQFMDKAQVKIHMADAWLHPPLSGNDINIMDHFMQQNNPIQKLLQINRCRVYLQVLSLSDLAPADGARLIAPALSGSHLIDR